MLSERQENTSKYRFSWMYRIILYQLLIGLRHFVQWNILLCLHSIQYSMVLGFNPTIYWCESSTLTNRQYFILDFKLIAFYFQSIVVKVLEFEIFFILWYYNFFSLQFRFMFYLSTTCFRHNHFSFDQIKLMFCNFTTQSDLISPV